MFDIKKIKSGDILCFLPEEGAIKSIIDAVNEPIAHVEIAYCLTDVGNTKQDFYDKSKQQLKVQTLAMTDKGMNWEIRDINSKNIAILRNKDLKFDDIKMRNLIRQYMTEHTQKKTLEYDYVGLADASLNALLKFISFGLYEKHKLISNSDENKICSESVADIYNWYYGDLFNNASCVTPTDLYRCNKFEVIKDFGYTIEDKSLIDWISSNIVIGR